MSASQPIRPGDLFAFAWDDDDGRPDGTYRVLEVVAVEADTLKVGLYSDRFTKPPATAVALGSLHRVRLHEHVGFPIDVPRDEFERWRPIRIPRAS